MIIIFGCNKVLTGYIYGQPQNSKFPTEDLFFNVNESILKEEGKYLEGKVSRGGRKVS